jgi:Fe-S cluster assembly iron-binding protein IscA
MTLDEPKEDETTTTINGIDVIIAEEVKRYAEKTTVDYVTGPYRQGFIIGVGGNAGC